MLKRIASSIAVSALLVLVFSCEGNFRDVQRINSKGFNPVGETENINLKYTDSGKVKSTLVSPLMKDYTNLEYGFNEFPEGVHLILYDTNGAKTHVESKYAIVYEDTDVIDLQGNVRIYTDDGKKLTTEQLYFDQKNEWFYTEKFFKFTDADGSFLEGPGIDFSKDFKVMNTQRSKGAINNVK
jgi:LPS export ABC transporter protein LptC